MKHVKKRKTKELSRSCREGGWGRGREQGEGRGEGTMEGGEGKRGVRVKGKRERSS